MAVLIAFAVILVAGALVLAAGALTLPGRQRRAMIARAVGADRLATPSLADRGARDRLVLPFADAVGSFVLRVSPSGMVTAAERRLVAAGLLGRVSPATFLGAKIVLGVGGVVFGAFAGGLGKAGGVVLAICFGAALFILPDFLLKRRLARRQDLIRAELPEALDLLAVSIEAGLGLDAALATVNDEMTGPLSDEFSLTLAEMRVGETRQEAFRKLGERTDVPEIASVARAITQSDQLGISLGRVLRLQANDARMRQQGAAEEKANRLPVKMLFPTVIFIFPALFIVVLGPAFITIFHTL